MARAERITHRKLSKEAAHLTSKFSSTPSGSFLGIFGIVQVTGTTKIRVRKGMASERVPTKYGPALILRLCPADIVARNSYHGSSSIKAFVDSTIPISSSTD